MTWSEVWTEFLALRDEEGIEVAREVVREFSPTGRLKNMPTAKLQEAYEAAHRRRRSSLTR